MIYLIWAMTKDGVIANKQQLPWNIKEEMAYFRKMTIGKTVLMGSKTLLSIGQPLKNRKNIIITNNPEKYAHFKSESCIINNDLPAIIEAYSHKKENELWIIGGQNIYQQTWTAADYLYVSIIKDSYQGDLKFPETDFSDFKLVSQTDFEKFTASVWKRKD